jgi:hypothetical protein
LPTPKKPDHLLVRRRRMVTSDTKRCKTCSEVKHVSQFHTARHYDRPGQPKYLAPRCKPCAAEQNRMRLYGVTLAEMIAKQGTALCPLCLKRMADSVDHDHLTRKARGALCRKCNLIMHYMDNAEWVARAKEYIHAGQIEGSIEIS